MASVTCQTAECGNQGISLSVNLTWTDENGETQSVDSVMCGVCGQPITDIQNDERITA